MRACAVNHPMTHRRIVPLLLLFFMASAAPVHAYLLSATQITHQMVRKLGKPVTVSMTQKEVFFRNPTAPDADEEPLVFDEVVRFTAPDRFHASVVTDGKKVEQFSTFNTWFRVVDGKATQGPERAADRYRDPLQFRSESPIKARLTAAGVDLSVTSLNRHAGRIAWVVGASPTDTEVRPQFWVDKESFLPMRWVLFEGKKNPRKVEIWYHGWFKQGNSFFPKRVEFYADGRLFREIRVEKVSPAKALPAKLFDRAAHSGKKATVSPVATPARELTEQEKQMKEIERILSNDPLAF